MSYPVPKDSCERELEIKKSRFIGFATHVSSREDALAQVAAVKAKYPDARHHCWAYVLGNAVSAAMNDDGEPSGTAGKPILNVLQHKGIGDILVVVTRYFGGVKLGAGGLVRAYSQTAELVVSALTLEVQTPQTQAQIHCDFATEQAIRHQLELAEGQVVRADYSHEVELTVSFPDSALTTLQQFAAAAGARLKVLTAAQS